MNLSILRSSFLFALISIGFNIVQFSSSVTAAFKYLHEGMEAPPLRGKDIISGSQVNYEDYIKQNVVIITFWATWSSRSLELLNELQAFSDENSDKPVKIIAVNVDNQKIGPEEEKRILKTVTDMNLSFPVIIDYGLEAFYEFGVIAVPSTAILDTSGVLRYAPSGYSLSTRDRIIDSLNVLLGLREPTAITAIREGYIPEPKSSRYYRLAQQLAGKRMYERALSNLELSEQADTLFSAPHNLRGQIYLELDSIQLAIEEFEKAVELDSTSIAARAGLARGLLRDGRFGQAFENLSSLLADDSTYTPALLDFALCHAEKDEIETALVYLDKAKELNPKDPMVYYYFGKIYFDSGQVSKAAESFREGLEILYRHP